MLRADHRGDVREATPTGDGLAYALSGQVRIDLGTREITIDLGEAEPSARISLGKTPTDRLKRLSDIVLVAATAVLWLPLLAVLAVAVKCTSRGPVFYAQTRLG